MVSTLTDYETDVLRHLNVEATLKALSLDDALPNAIDKLESLGLIKQAYVLTDRGKQYLWAHSDYKGAKG